jgi:hypothetical protein
VGVRDGVYRTGLSARSGCARSPEPSRWAGKAAVLGWIARHSQHERGDHGGKDARGHDGEDEQRDAGRRCDRDEGHD